MTDNKVDKIPEGKICDFIDGHFRKDTPEEYVRQTIEKRLINEHGYSRDQVRVEFTLHVGSGKPRVDLAIFKDGNTPQTQENILVAIECKKESIPSTAKKDGVGQLKSYMSCCPNCEYGLWTNSIERHAYHKYVDESGKVCFEEVNDIPPANGDMSVADRPSRKDLRSASGDNLLFVFRTCHNHIYANDGLQKQQAFFELLKLIFCKIEDEHNLPHPLEFYATSAERRTRDGQLMVQKRINGIFEKVKSTHGKIFDDDAAIELSPRSLAYIVSELQRYSLLNTNIDIKGKAYEEIVGANLRGDRGQFFTPRNVMAMVVEMLNPTDEEKVADTSCGTGGFIVMAMTHVLRNLESECEVDFGKPHSEWSADEENMFRSCVSAVASHNFFGFDIDRDLAKATKMNMVMNNDGSGNILQLNSLLPPHEWTDDFRTRFTKALGIKKNDIINWKNLDVFDVIVTNPPFGVKIPIKDPLILEQFELAHIWEHDKKSGTWTKTDRLQSSVPPEILFIERCTQFLVDGGRMGIVLPDSILGSPGLGYIRTWLIQNHRIVASIDLHQDTFQPHNGVQTSVLILQKKTTAEKATELASGGHMADYEVFMAMVDRVGHDKRGNPLFVRDAEGNEVSVSDEPGQPGHPVIDDQTTLIPAIFSDWKVKEGIAW